MTAGHVISADDAESRCNGFHLWSAWTSCHHCFLHTWSFETNSQLIGISAVMYFFNISWFLWGGGGGGGGGRCVVDVIES